jgi:uncharacterized protein (DUF433 family)
MKLNKVERPWRGTRTHRREALSKRRENKWRLFLRHRHSCIESREFQSTYSESTINLFTAAIRRCPSIYMDEEVMEGQPCIIGTRIPVRSVLRAVEQYGSVKDAVQCYPHLNAEQIKDALYFTQIILELPA